jgi:DNA-binding response OmpR family regulator
LTRPAFESGATPVDTDAHNRIPVRSHRIAVVDDNTDAADSLAIVLRLEGHKVSVFYDGQSALAGYEALRPDVVILDIGMPLLNGYELAEKIRALNYTPRPRLIAVTGWGQAADKDRATAAGIDHHFTKPLEFDALLPVVAARV